MDWILDVDSTIKQLYGKQEEAQVGYNRGKPGRASHVYHTYWIGKIPLFLGVDIHPGNEHHSKYGLDHLVDFLLSLKPNERPRIVRADCGYGNDRWMSQMEEIH